MLVVNIPLVPKTYAKEAGTKETVPKSYSVKAVWDNFVQTNWICLVVYQVSEMQLH